MFIPEKLKERIDEVAEYVGTTTSDFLVVKRQLINCFPPTERWRFSHRHNSTRKHTLNGFDQEVIEYWFQSTGIRLVVNPNKLHDPGWEHRKKGWSLIIFNEKKKKNNEFPSQDRP